MRPGIKKSAIRHAWIWAGCGLLAAGARAADAPPEPAPWFPVGETLVYQVRWGVIPVAESVASTAWIEDEGARRLQLLVRTRSNSFLSRIYPVDDTIETLLDPATLLPLRFTVRLNEGRHHTHEVTTFDHSAGEAVWRRIRPPPAPEKVRRFAIESNTVDLLTFMYQLRRTPMAPGTNYEHRVMVDEKIYDLTLRTERHEKIKLDRYGDVRSLKLEPVAVFNGIFVRKGRMWTWISEDERRLCTQASVAVPVARVHVRLHRVEGPGDDFWRRPTVAERKD